MLVQAGLCLTCSETTLLVFPRGGSFIKGIDVNLTYKIKIELRSFKSSEHINERRDGPYHGFGYLSLFSDPLDLAKWGQREIQ